MDPFPVTDTDATAGDFPLQTKARAWVLEEALRRVREAEELSGALKRPQPLWTTVPPFHLQPTTHHLD